MGQVQGCVRATNVSVIRRHPEMVTLTSVPVSEYYSRKGDVWYLRDAMVMHSRPNVAVQREEEL